MAPKLIAEEGLLKGLVLSLEQGDQWVLGRDPDACSLLLEDPEASRQHLVLRTTPEGILAENVSETNPTLVNDEALQEPRVLHHGDKLKIGNGTYRYYIEAKAEVDDLTQEEAPSPKEVGEEAAEQEPRHDSLFDETDAVEEESLLAEVDLNINESGPLLLKVIAGPNNGAEFALESDKSYVLGTDPSTSDIVFQDVSVSRQHARLTIGPDDAVTIEDLESSNATMVEGEKVENTLSLPPDTIVSLGTTSFIVYSLEEERSTVISPLLPAIVKVLKDKEEQMVATQKTGAEAVSAGDIAGQMPEPAIPPAPRKNQYVFTAVIVGILLLLGFGVSALFRVEEIEMAKFEPIKEIERTLLPYPTVNYQYTRGTGRVLLVGHVLTAIDRNQLVYNLQVLPFVKNIDDKIVVDEYIWQETNQVLAKNPSWRGIALHSPSAERFVISGYLNTRAQADELNDYLSQNFPYLDLLENRVVVEEDVIAKARVLLHNNGFRDIKPNIDNGVITLEGAIPAGSRSLFDQINVEIQQIDGVRNVRSFVVELPPEEDFIDISDKYRISGSLTQGNEINVVINGKIVGIGDFLDGMKVIKITQNRVTLSREGVRYIIDYN